MATHRRNGLRYRSDIRQVEGQARFQRIIVNNNIFIGDKKKKRKILNQYSIVIEMSKRFAIDLVSEG